MTHRMRSTSDGTPTVSTDLRSTLASRVFRRFDELGISYCHWKSNEHLDAALAGLTDLDILIDAARLDDAYAVLSEFDCRRGRVASARNEPGLEDFFGIDPLNDRLIHFHVHWRLASGERHLKRFRLPWESQVLTARIRDEATGAYMTHPAQEVVLVMVRAALKLRWRDRIKLAVKREAKTSAQNEAAWLMKSTDEESVRAIATEWLSSDSADAILAALSNGVTGKNLVGVRRCVLDQIGTQTSHTPIAAALVRNRRELAWLQRGVARHYRPRPVLYGRGGPAGGLLVAVLGADGSGKSTLTGDLRRWFAPKYDTYAVYLGSGDGPSSVLRLPLRWAKQHILGLSKTNSPGTTPGGQRSKSLQLSRVIWALVLAREKRQKLQRAMLARTRGLLVITDRYPQTQVAGSNDGPLLSGWIQSANPLLRFVARRELAPYTLADRFPPDLILRLDVAPDVAAGRRPGQSRDYLKARIDLVTGLEFPRSRFGIVALDANRPYDSVLGDAIQAIFSRM